jgi:hypothetical protein
MIPVQSYPSGRHFIEIKRTTLVKSLIVLVEGRMHRRNVLTLAGLFGCTCLVGLSGCATLSRPLPERRPTQVYASFSKTWGAAVDYFARSGVSVDTTDRLSGIIRADATTMPLDESHFGLCGNSVPVPSWSKYVGFYWTRKYGERPFGAPFTAIVHGDSTRATVSVTADWIDTHGKQIKCSASLKTGWEQQTEGAIKTKAEGH